MNGPAFIREEEEIFTYPMKGTIDAAIEDAENVLLQNKKEEWEHNTIVDLLRRQITISKSVNSCAITDSTALAICRAPLRTGNPMVTFGGMTIE